MMSTDKEQGGGSPGGFPADCRILIVAEEARSRQALHETLSRAGFAPVSVADADTARASCRDGVPELVLMEVQRLDEDAFALIRWLAQERLLPIVVIDGGDSAGEARRTAREGGHGYLAKPFTEAQLLATIDIALLRQRQCQTLNQRTAELRQALATNRLISTAVGILMERHRFGEQDAFDHLRAKARAAQRKVEELAREVVDAACELNLSERNPPSGAPPHRDSRRVDEGIA